MNFVPDYLSKVSEAFSKVADTLSPSFKTIASFPCNGETYEIEGKGPGIFSHEKRYFIRVSGSKEEKVREVFRHLNMQRLMSKKNLVGRNGYATFEIGQQKYRELKEWLGTIAPPHFSPPNHNGTTENTIFDEYNQHVLGIKPIPITNEHPRRPPGLPSYKHLRKRPFTDLTKETSF